mgnify:CR=1 FL=1
MLRMNRKKIKILMISLAIIVISLSVVWQIKKFTDVRVYNSILAEKPFYFEIRRQRHRNISALN